MKFTMKPGLLRLIYQPVIGRDAIAGLVGRNRDRAQPAKGRFTHADVQAMLAQVWKEYDQLAPKVQKIPAPGNQMNLYLSCVTFCCFQTLLGLGIERNYAIELISDMAWKVYEKWGAIPFMFARLRNRDPRGRMRFAVNAFFAIPVQPARIPVGTLAQRGWHIVQNQKMYRRRIFSVTGRDGPLRGDVAQSGFRPRRDVGRLA